MRTLLLILCILIVAFANAQNVGLSNSNPQSKLDVSGDMSLREGAPIAVTSGSNTITLPSSKNSVYRLTGAGSAFSISSISTGNNGAMLTLINTTGQIMTITNSTTVLTNTGADLVASGTVSSLSMIYNSTIAKWIVTSGQGFISSSSGSTGPTGPTGSAGVGATGVSGPAGPAGSAGATGAIGAIGPAGPPGSAGTAGSTGATGTVGPTGSTGANGATGATGPAGPVGAAGSAGPVGPTGSSGTGILGSGNIYTLPKFITTTTIGNSVISDSGTNVNINYAPFNNGVAPAPMITDKSGNLLTIQSPYLPYFQTKVLKTASGSFSVPAGVYQIYVVVIGGGGGGGYRTAAKYAEGGNGGEVMGIIDVNPGESLTIVVGAGGVSASSGSNTTAAKGALGNGSSISRSSTLLAAGGGGGGGTYTTTGKSYGGGGGGAKIGTSPINGVTSTGAASSTAGGDNFFGYVRNAISYAGFSYGTTASGNNGYSLNVTGIIPFSTFESSLGSLAYGSGGYHTTNGGAGVVAIFY
jgi:hypothetical protein